MAAGESTGRRRHGVSRRVLRATIFDGDTAHVIMLPEAMVTEVLETLP